MPTQPFRIPETPDYVGFARQNAMLDFSPINNAVSSWQQQQQRDVENKRAEDQLGFQRERLGMDKQRVSDEQKKNLIETFGNVAMLYDPAKDVDGAQWTGIVNGYDAKMRSHDPSFGGSTPDYYDRVQGPKLILGDAKMAAQQLDYKMRQVAEGRASQQLDLARAKDTRDAIESTARTANIGKTDSIREFLFAKDNGFGGTYDAWQKDQENNALKFGLNPIPFMKSDGIMGYMVPNTRGATKELDIPSGGKAMPKVSYVSTPTHTITKDVYGNEIGREAKDIAGAKLQAEIGEARGKAQVDLPGVEMRANMMNKSLDALQAAITANPRMVGPYTGLLRNVTATAVDTQAKIDQVQGKVFLQAYDSLRGAGAISEGEGKPATAAISRLQQTAVGTTQYLSAIEDVRKELSALVELAKKKAGGGVASGDGWSIEKVQ